MDTENLGTSQVNPSFITRQPHHLVTTALSYASPQPVVRDLENLFGDASFKDDKISHTDIGSSQWSTLLGTNGMSMTRHHSCTPPPKKPRGKAGLPPAEDVRLGTEDTVLALSLDIYVRDEPATLPVLVEPMMLSRLAASRAFPDVGSVNILSPLPLVGFK